MARTGDLIKCGRVARPGHPSSDGESALQRTGALEPAPRIGVEGALDGLDEGRGEIRARVTQRDGRAGAMLLDQCIHRVRFDGEATADQAVQDDAEAVYIRGGRGRLVRQKMFGGHEERSAAAGIFVARLPAAGAGPL